MYTYRCTRTHRTPGFYSETEGETNCTECGPEEVSGFGAKSCFQCKAGKFFSELHYL